MCRRSVNHQQIQSDAIQVATRKGLANRRTPIDHTARCLRMQVALIRRPLRIWHHRSPKSQSCRLRSLPPERYRPICRRRTSTGFLQPTPRTSPQRTSSSKQALRIPLSLNQPSLPAVQLARIDSFGVCTALFVRSATVRSAIALVRIATVLNLYSPFASNSNLPRLL